MKSHAVNESFMSSKVPDFSDACLKFISDILLEEGLDENPVSVEEYRALQKTEKSLYDVLGEKYSHSFLQENVNEILNHPCSLSSSSNSLDDSRDGATASPVSTLYSVSIETQEKLGSCLGVTKNRRKRDGNGCVEGRSYEHQGSYNEDYDEMEQYDDVLLSQEGNSDIITTRITCCNNEGVLYKKRSRGRIGRGNIEYNEAEEVDLRSLLSQCAQAVSNFDLRGANEIIRQIRQHSSPYGDSLQRLAHVFANALEERLAGSGHSTLYEYNDGNVRMTSSQFLKAYKVYMSAVPFKRASYFLANNVILKLAEKATRVHIIDFGISLGLQWPDFIQNLSKRPLGPPKLHITGIDSPEHGFRPAERVEATGRRLSGYCDRFNVPFEYHAIAQKWETVKLGDLKIDSDELVIVNCMFRSGLLIDDTVDANSPRDDFLRLVKKINPHLFIHGTSNGRFNAPFFITRFREALFHYSSMFDVFEATMPRENRERLLIESEIYGKDVSNVIACEVAERIQRPETYKKWQGRTTRAGLRQLPLDQRLLSRAKAMVKANYHKDFVVDEDCHWMLQGWKGRILYGLSFWQPK